MDEALQREEKSRIVQFIDMVGIHKPDARTRPRSKKRPSQLSDGGSNDDPA
jgi:hypothetical protein